MGKLAAKKALLETENAAMDNGLAELEAARFSERLWSKDPSLWKDDKEHAKLIRRALGWLDAPTTMAAGLGAVRVFADGTSSEGFRHAVVLGMGGSSLCVSVLRAVFGAVPGRPQLLTLDSTHPDAVTSLEKCLDLKKTLFIVASKSGSTIEPNSFFDHFWAEVSRQTGVNAGRQFVAITDPGTALEKLSRERGFRKTFLNPSDVGGRFSALTLFGLVPAALAGIDVAEFLTRARAAARSFSPQTPTRENAALRLGAFLGVHAREGRDKLTLVLPPALETFGLWIEQLVAESTGKEGRGLLPVVAEPLAAPEAYGRDRVFVRLALAGHAEPAVESSLTALARAGHPVLRLEMADLRDLGAQFLLWEVATAAVGFFLKIDPFDQPDVQTAKERAKEILSKPRNGEAQEKASFRAGGLPAFADPGLTAALRADPGQDRPLRQVLKAHLARVRPGDYVAILAFLAETDESRRLLEEVRRLARTRATAPVTISWGPRYLHSTGQFHKGGPDKGVFVVLGEPERLR
ncbi:MAG: hypothetical protein AAB262_08365, partial [Elusimicrobiota bacterium]